MLPQKGREGGPEMGAKELALSEREESGLAVCLSLSRAIVVRTALLARRSLESQLPASLSLENVGLLAAVLALLLPRPLTYLMIYPAFRLVFGTLYPAYASYKAVRTKNVKEYVSMLGE